MNRPLTLMAVACCVITSCQKQVPDKLGYQIISTRPHDGTAYTQGLQLTGGRLFESTGQYGESTVREIEPATGKVLRKRPLAKTVFGEGLTVIDREMWVLTWKESTVYVLEPDTFKPIRTHTYQGEGWGLTTDGKQLIMSDGSSDLKFINPKDFTVLKTLAVKDGKSSVKNLNELEWIDGQIFANVYMTDKVARISPETGEVTGWLDLAGLKKQLTPPNHAEVLNGIAYDKSSGNLLVTGVRVPRVEHRPGLAFPFAWSDRAPRRRPEQESPGAVARRDPCSAGDRSPGRRARAPSTTRSATRHRAAAGSRARARGSSPPRSRRRSRDLRHPR